MEDILLNSLYVIGPLLVALGGAGFYFSRSKSSKHPEPGPELSEESPELSGPGASADGAGADGAGDAQSPAVSAPSAPSAPSGPGAPSEAPSTALPSFDQPEAAASRMTRLRARLARSGSLGKAVLQVLSRAELAESDWEEIEDTLLMADLGLGPTEELMEQLRTWQKVSGTSEVTDIKQVLREALLRLVDPNMDRSLNLEQPRGENGQLLPATVLVVGVNGSGKTTTVGKIARLLVAENKTVLLGAADTFRAAAAEQLQTWGSRVGVEVVRSEKEGADPASVAFESVKTAIEEQKQVLLVDTAGRLQNKVGLMDELGKVKRVMEKQAPVSETLLVLDATTGQNGLSQARVFAEVAEVTGIVLTKLDGSAKGGIVVAVQRELGVPVKLVGLGEGPDDIAPFDPVAFVEAIIDEK